MYPLLVALLSQCVDDADGPAYTLGRVEVSALTSAAPPITAAEKQFLAAPSPVSARANLQHITSRPHVAGTPGDYAMAEFVRDQMHHAGIPTVKIDPQRVLLTYPLNRSLDLVDQRGDVLLRAPLSEAILPSDPTSDTWWRNHTFNAYSPSGTATAPIVYANFGFPEDFAKLNASGVDVRGAIVLMRYGKCFRGLKAMNAERNGALAALIYSDPEQDGFAKGSVYPEGPWRPPSSVQRAPASDRTWDAGKGSGRAVCAAPPSLRLTFRPSPPLSLRRRLHSIHLAVSWRPEPGVSTRRRE
jgi:N-acetylated-alpha-linked acidic dipeptidase